MEHLTIRRIPPEVADALDKEKRRRGHSLNQTVIDLLEEALGVERVHDRRNGLARLAGTWSAEEHAQFEAAVALTEQIDEELWK